MKLNEEFFLPGETVMEQSSAVDQLYIVSHGCLVMFPNLCLLSLQLAENLSY